MINTICWIIAYVATILVGVISILYLYAVRKQQYWKKKGVKYCEPSVIFGNYKDAALRKTYFGDAIRNIYNKFPGDKYVGTYFFQNPVLMIRDPDFIKTVLLKDFNHFAEHNRIINDKGDPLQAKNLFHLTGQLWKHMRIKLTPTFTSGKMKKMFPLVCECAEELNKYLEKYADEGEIIEMKETIAKYTTDVIASCAFGIQVNSLKNPDAEFREMGKRINGPPGLLQGIKLFCVGVNPDLSKYFTLRLTPIEVTEFMRKVVKETIEYREANGIRRNDFMDLLLQLRRQGKVEEEDGVETDNSEEMKEPDVFRGKWWIILLATTILNIIYVVLTTKL